MKKHLSSHSTIDYRNARYQGPIDSKGNRQSLGILVDDDLSFYVSHWNDNLLNDQTLVYISHGKYIYGQWLNNEPHGLNVFRTGDTVLVGEFRNGKIIGKILVIFERYNMIAILQARSQRDKFDVLQCGKLMTHNDLLKYIDFLDLQMPDNYFSLIKFVTSLTLDDDQNAQAIIASPCQGENCYFGYMEGLAIIFNSNNGVVSVGQHEDKSLFGFGGKFDGTSIEEGNFETGETITYHKKRPDNQIYTIFQKMHKRSLNFKNQYFDSKVKTLGDLQNILRGNIQKIINQNMKNGIRQATAEDLNDSLDYQNFQNYESIKTAENRQKMYEKQSVNMKKTTSQYCQENKYFPKSQKPVPSESTSRKINHVSTENQNYSQSSQVQETVRRTPVKDSTVYYAKKSPIRYKEEDKQIYGKDSKASEKTQNYEEEPRNKKHIPQSIQKDETRVGKTYKRSSVYEKSQRSIDKSPLSYSKNLESKTNEKQTREKIPKFAGLEIQQNEKSIRKSTVQNEVQEYKRQLQKSRSREKQQGKSLGKCLKRPNYEDIEERRKRLLNQFKELNVSNNQSKVSAVSDIKTNNRHKASLEIEIDENSRQSFKKNIAQSPCMKEKILSFNSDTDQNTENSEEGYLPLSLLNCQKPRKNRNLPQDPKPQCNGSTFSKKQLLAEKQDVSKTKVGKQNASYTPGSFAKYKRSEDVKNQNYVNEKKNQIRRFYCQESENFYEPTTLTKKTQSQHIVSQNEEEEDNRFSDIQLRHQNSQMIENYSQKKYGAQKSMHPSRSRSQIFEKQTNLITREPFANRQKTASQHRDLSPSIVSDVSRRKTGYKYYFEE